MKTFTSAQSRELRARAHALNPVVMISEGGLSNGVLAEIERNLKSHELIKVRIFGAGREERNIMLASICVQTGAMPIQHIGKIVVIYRENTEKIPARSATARPRRPQPRSMPVTARFHPGSSRRKAFSPRTAAPARAGASRGTNRAQKDMPGSGRTSRSRPPSR